MIPALLLFAGAGLAAQTLQDTLRTAGVPTGPFSATVLAQPITSFALSKEPPFLLAYYVDDGSHQLRPPLRVIRYDRATGDLRRADLRDIKALFQGTIPMDCLGAALRIREHRATVFLETHNNPSAGCLLVLSSRLEFKTALSGWLLGLMGDYAIVRASEIHFMSVHPMHISAFDVRRGQSTELFPYQDDPQRRQFSRLLKPLISDSWCMKYNAQCDPDNFDTDPEGKLAVNEAAGVFGFQAKFDALGFGPAAERRVPPRLVAYFFRERAGQWEHRQFAAPQLQRLLAGLSFKDLVANDPNRPFQPPVGW